MGNEIDIHAPGVEMRKSLCYFCHANCGVLAYVKDGEVIKIEGDPNYANQGGLCCRGNSALLHLNHPARINHALKRVGAKGEGKWEKIPYDQAITEVAERLNQIKAESGAEAVATAGGTTRTDDWARRRFLNQFGSPNGFHNALLCWIPTFMAETCVAGWSPFETDLGSAKVVMLWGMNPGASSLGAMRGYTDLQKNGMKIICVDPRFSETASKADLWLPLRPGSDSALALALLRTIIWEGLCDFAFVRDWCQDFDALKEHVRDYTPEWAAPLTWLSPEQIRAAARMYATNPINSYGDSKMTLQALKQCEFLVTVDYWMTPTALLSDYVFPAAGALERPTIVTHYGATDSILGGKRAMQPLYDRHTDMTFWRKLGIACGQPEEMWPWKTEEEAYYHILEPLGLPISCYDEFVDNYRMYYPPLHQNKFIANGGFWTPSGKVECDSSILRELGYPGMPTYLGCSENEVDDPEVAEKYPIVLTTGGGFMPFHHSEHFQMPGIRYLYPDPYFTINPVLAEKLGIAEGDWCWIETRRGRIKMRANVSPELDPRVVFAPRGWWFPERDGSADLSNPFGCLESNVNVLTSVDVEDCDPMGGSWANRGLMCRVYKCTELDHDYKPADAQWSIPGNAAEPGVTVMPSDQKMARPHVPFEAPEVEEAPEGFYRVWQNGQLYQEGTHFRLDESGWLVNPRTKGYHDAYTGWRYDPASELLVDDATGKSYTMDREEVSYLGGVRCYPGAEAPFEVPEQLTWNAEGGYAQLADKPYVYDPASGWLVDPETGAFHDAYYGWLYDGATGHLVDEATDAHYDMEYNPIVNEEAAAARVAEEEEGA